MLIAQISDSHVLVDGKRIAGRFDTAKSFDRLIASLSQLKSTPDIILFTGDLGENATDEEYQFVGARLRSLGIPVFAIPGNHDKRNPMWSGLPDMVQRTEQGHLCVYEEDYDLAIIGLDTIVEGFSHGELCRHRLDWLSKKLRICADRPVLILMHHPPILTGLKDMDSMGLLSGREELAMLVAEHGKVEAILCGHMHRSIQGLCGGAPVRVSPSSSHQIAFDIRDDQTYKFTDESPQYMMHVWSRGQNLISHVVPVDSE